MTLTQENPVIRKGCVTTAAAIIAAKWTPQIIYALANGTNRFCDIQKEAGGVNPRTLSARLDELEDAGIIERQTLATSPPCVEYSLTERGQGMIPILESMIEWGEKYPPTSEEKAACESAFSAA